VSDDGEKQGVTYEVVAFVPHSGPEIRAYYHSGDPKSPVDFTNLVIGWEVRRDIAYPWAKNEWVPVLLNDARCCYCEPPGAIGNSIQENFVGVFDREDEGRLACAEAAKEPE
jgi:hypothetical protein